MLVTLLLLAGAMTMLSSRSARAHERHFETHPEWDHLWPDPFTLNDLGRDETRRPDLTGRWKAGTNLLNVFPSGGGYGSGKDRLFARSPPAPPGTAYDVACSDAAGNDCSAWTRARIVLSSNFDTARVRFLVRKEGRYVDATDAVDATVQCDGGRKDTDAACSMRVDGEQWIRETTTTTRGAHVNSEIHTVHMVFMNHLDIGYTTYVNNVLNEYIHDYFQQVEHLGDAMRALEGTDRFVYLTHPWLMSLFFDCPCPDDPANGTSCAARSLNNTRAPPLRCPTTEEMDTFNSAVSKGDIKWHAAPMNVQAENMGPTLFEAGLKMTRAFDAKYFPDSPTITMSDRDVIYVTRSVIPLLSKYGVKGLTIGSNGANYPPQVPKLHLWRDLESDTEVIVFYHPYGYGGYSKSTCDGPGQCGDCVEAPNGFALCTEFRTDNTGPPTSTEEIIQSLDAVRAEYPNASVFASTFDNFVRDVLPVKEDLPVVTAEVGDTWMYGAPSDPLKLAQNRELQRVWEECLEREANMPTRPTGESSCDWSQSAAIRNMTRFLFKAPEHTYGTPGIAGWGAGNVYNRSTFLSVISTPPFYDAASSWAEQRIYNALAVEALEHADHPLAVEARARFDALSRVSRPDLSTLSKVSDALSVISLGGTFDIAFDRTGALVKLARKTASSSSPTTTQWASETSSLAGLVYQTLNESDWKPFTYDYINGHGEAAGFSKPGSNNFTVGRHFRPSVVAVYASNETAVAHMKFSVDAVETYGSAPTDVYLNVTADRASDSLLLELVTIGKLPTMIGESLMLTFVPLPQLRSSGAWSLDVLGSPVDPEDVLDGGNQFNHGTWSGGAEARTVLNETLRVVSLDASNMCPQTPDYPLGNPLPAGSEGLKQLARGSVFGMAVNLHNNLWNTNYPLFYPYFDAAHCTSPLDCSNANTRYRFRLDISSGKRV